MSSIERDEFKFELDGFCSAVRDEIPLKAMEGGNFECIVVVALQENDKPESSMVTALYAL